MMEQDVKAQHTPGHRWSGWPGAWCLDCGCDDPYEVALADGLVDFGPDGETPIIAPEVRANINAKLVCPEPGSKRHDPYDHAAIARATGEQS